jgi:hypothetical protein
MDPIVATGGREACMKAQPIDASALQDDVKCVDVPSCGRLLLSPDRARSRGNLRRKQMVWTKSRIEQLNERDFGLLRNGAKDAGL